MKTNTYMLKTIFVSFMLSFCIIYPTVIDYEQAEYIRYTKTFKWLTLEEYNILFVNCRDRKVPIENMLSTIQMESEGNRNAIHLNYRDGEVVSTDYGLCQVNSCRREGYTDEELMRLDINIKLGVKAYAEAWYKSKGVVSDASRFYNAGLNSKKEKYKNWGYPKGVERHIASIEDKNSFYQLYK